MPIPLVTTIDDDSSMIIYPDENGQFIIKHNNKLIMSCPGNKFISPNRIGLKNLAAKCFNGNLKYKGRIYDFNKFKCATNPKPKIVVTQNMCQELSNNVIEVGFETFYGFKILYKICFDVYLKNTLYTWYFVNLPINNYIQHSAFEPKFVSPYFKDNGELVEDCRELVSI